MCSICGIYNSESLSIENLNEINKLNNAMKHRGPDQSGTYSNNNVVFGHNRLAVIDIENGLQPMSVTFLNNNYTIVYNGEIYNAPELTTELKLFGVELKTKCDTEVVLYSYIIWGEECPAKLNGIFAFAVYDENKNLLFTARDRLGVKPFYYTYSKGSFIFASEIKALLKYSGVSPVIDKVGLWQLLYLAPVTLNGSGVFKNIYELHPGECAVINNDGMQKRFYWELVATEFTESREEAIFHTRELLTDAIKRQLVSDVPLCTFLSGGLDSSIVTSVASMAYKEKGMKLSTYSFEYEGNSGNFKKTLFQPNSDDEYALWLSEYLGTKHTVLTASNDIVADYLVKATYARDIPGQADIDSSLMYYCEKVKENHTVAMSGECADEIFGGYPWFYRPEMLERDFFPWIHEPRQRISLFYDDIVKSNEGYEYMSEIYKQSISECPVLEDDSPDMMRSRRATYLSVYYFMQSLLERKDRMSMASGVEVRVPFSDHRILEYVYNIPWEIKFEGGVEKALLRNAMKDYLPERILNRKKSPYPKTHNPVYEELVTKMLLLRLENKSSRLNHLLNKDKLVELLNGNDVTWFGQLMSKPQLLAWLIQLDTWFEEYDVELI